MECRVFVAACPDYAQAEEKTAELIERMGGMGRFARPGETLLLKANLLAAAGPEQAVSTAASRSASGRIVFPFIGHLTFIRCAKEWGCVMPFRRGSPAKGSKPAWGA